MSRIALVTTWHKACGISEHAAYLKTSVEAADPDLKIEVVSELHPSEVLERPTLPSVIILNYQAAVLSQWHPEHIREAQAKGSKVLVIWHDSGVPNTDQCKALYAVADRMIVHEPAEDLPEAIYWRMGVPAAEWQMRMSETLGYPDQPLLGSIGFPSGWKNYTEIAKIAGRSGWALLLIAPTATAEQVAEWKAVCPDLHVRSDFVPRREALRLLSGCDATAFFYVTNNAGQSGAILQGIAARKPVLALSTCRQFRALYADPLGVRTIQWCGTFEQMEDQLRLVRIQRVDPGIVALAEQESWARLGVKYAGLIRELSA